MRLPNLNYDLWQLIISEDCAVSTADYVMSGTQNLQRSPAAIPYATDLQILQRGEAAKLIFEISPTCEEIESGMPYRTQQLWVAIAERRGDYYIGILNEHPHPNYVNCDFYLRPGAEIPFLPQHIIDVDRPPSGFDIETILQPQKIWSGAENSPLVMGDPVLDELLDLAVRHAVRDVQQETFTSAFGIGSTTGQTWSDRFIGTGIITQDGSEALMEAMQPLQERARQNTLLASAICTCRQLERASGETSEAIVIFLENAVGYSVYWIKTYRKTANGYEFDDLVAQFGKPAVFLPELSNPSTPTPSNRTATIDVDKETLYQQLQELLSLNCWLDADRKTYQLCSVILGKTEEEIQSSEIEALPCSELARIDRLWVQFSDGKFGFSIQKRIWDEICETVDDFSWSGYEYYRSIFCERVGWQKKPTEEADYYKQSVGYEQLCLSKIGQLPNGRATKFFGTRHYYLGWNGEYWHGNEATVDEFGLHFDSLMAKIATCQLPVPAEKSVDLLITELSHHTDPEVRISAAYALGKIRAKEAIPALGQIMNDPHSYVRRNVIDALGRIMANKMPHSNDFAAVKAPIRDLVHARENGYRSSELTALISLGQVYTSISCCGKAIDCYEQALSLAHQLNDCQKEALAAANLGVLYGSVRYFTKAINYYEQAIQLYQQTPDNLNTAVALINLGVIYLESPQYTQSTSYFDRALILYQNLQNRNGEAYALMNLGSAYQTILMNRSIAGGSLISSFDRANDYYGQALTIFQALSDCDGELQALDRLSTMSYLSPL
jgi:tetratricopeptide (TPR) repeat protein